MSFSNDITTTVGQVRDLLGDTVSTSARWSDEQLNLYLTRAGDNVFQAAAEALFIKATSYAFVADVQVGNKRMSGAKVAENLRAQAESLLEHGRRTTGAAMPYAAGISIDDMDANYSNTDVPKPPTGAFLPDQYLTVRNDQWDEDDA